MGNYFLNWRGADSVYLLSLMPLNSISFHARYLPTEEDTGTQQEMRLEFVTSLSTTHIYPLSVRPELSNSASP